MAAGISEIFELVQTEWNGFPHQPFEVNMWITVHGHSAFHLNFGGETAAA
jgi:hypothetical protein